MEALNIDVKRVDVLPIVKHYIDKLGIKELFREALPSAKQAKTHSCEGLCLLLMPAKRWASHQPLRSVPVMSL